MRACIECQQDKPAEEFVSRCPACMECVHEWFMTEGPGVPKKSMKSVSDGAKLNGWQKQDHDRLERRRARAVKSGPSSDGSEKFAT